MNTPLSVDKRKQYKLARKTINTCLKVDWSEVVKNINKTILNMYATVFDTLGTAFKNVAENLQEINRKGADAQ